MTLSSSSRHAWISLAAVALASCAGSPATRPAALASTAGTAPLILGETFELDSTTLGQRRVINVYLPPDYRDGNTRYPVLYMPDGGLKEDFPHIMGVIDVSIKNAVIRPMIVVGIENIERRHDLVSATAIEAERARAPHAGGADKFRTFLRAELKPYIAAHYRVTAESALVGESLAGLFVLETLLTEPALFDSYIAIDPSVWWNGQALVRSAAARFASWSAGPKALFFASSEEKVTTDGTDILIAALRAAKPAGLVWHYLQLPEEHHSTIYPVAAVRAFRALFAMPAEPAAP